MKFPKKLNIGSTIFKIKYIQDRNKIPHELPADGLLDYSNKTIYVYDKMQDVEKIKTLLHEILHAIIYQNDLFWVYENKNHETTVEIISNQLVDIFLRNKIL